MLKLESEFQIIEHYFKQKKYNAANVIKGVGDDAAVLDITNHSNLIISMDTLVSGVHFPTNTTPYNIAYKSLAINLSDLAAMGASPAWFTLAITLPDNNPTWLKLFSEGLFDIAEQFKLDLVGGDTTQGPLNITIQIAGYVDDNKIMYRNGAQANDDIYITGSIGDAGAGLLLLNEPLGNQSDDYLISRLNNPTPRNSIGELIRNIASACIDISDGLLADLNHIISSSDCGAIINVERLPISTALKNSKIKYDYHQLALSAGDDYELCFCASEEKSEDIKSIANKLNIPITKIGKIVKDGGVVCYFENTPFSVDASGFEHFKNNNENKL